MHLHVVRLLCVAGAALGAEFGDIVEDVERKLQETGSGDVSSGTPPPPSPFSPPGAPGAAVLTQHAAFATMVVSGEVADYDTPETKASFAEAFANATGVTPDKVEITISSGSVVVQAKIIVESAAAATSAASTLNDVLATPAIATSFLSEFVPSVTVQTIAPVVAIQETVVTYPPPPMVPPPSSPPEDSGLSGGAIAAIIIGTLFGAAAIAGGAIYLMSQQGAAKSSSPQVQLTGGAENV